jgi:hypothetical protein
MQPGEGMNCGGQLPNVVPGTAIGTYFLRYSVELCALCGYVWYSVPPFSLPQYRREIVAAQAETLFHVTGNRDFCALARNTASAGKHPHSAGAVIDLKRTAPSGSIRIGDPSGDGHFPSRISAGILIQFGDARMRRASGQQQAGRDYKKSGDESKTMK